MKFDSIDDALNTTSDIEVSTTDEKKARTKAEEMCKKLLANLVIEDYKIL